ncbi:MAG: hypothetical protein ACRD28_13990 [Acidobacteriaceae bacterium]
MVEKIRQRSVLPLPLLAGMLVVGGFTCGSGRSQVNGHVAPPASPPTSQVIEEAETISIPVHAFSQANASPIKDLQASDLKLLVDGKPATFQLSRPWSETVNPKTGQTEDQPNLLIVLPLAGTLDRNDVINETIYAFKTAISKNAPPSGWNISILDDSGNQTAYTSQLPLVITELEKIGAEEPTPTNLPDWRHTLCVAIASMRDFPGRRVVLSLGDLFHEMVYRNYSLVYDAFEAVDVATAARASGAILYSADSSREVEMLRRLPPPYSVIGSGPWMLLTNNDNLLAGWICGPVAETLEQIHNNRMAAYSMELHLTPQQMDGLPHTVSVTSQLKQTVLNAPTFYPAPSLSQLRELSTASASLRRVLENPSARPAGPLQMGAQLEYFPHPDGKTGTQVVSAGLFWTADTPPPPSLELGQQLEEATTGLMASTTIRHLTWYATEPIWNTAIDVSPGDYRLRMAAADPAGKVTAGFTTDFTIAPADPDETVRISSLVIGRSCVFSPPAAQTGSQGIDYLRAGDCTIEPEPSHSFSPQDVLWTLVRITPVGKLEHRPAKDWKGDFVLLDEKGSKLAQQPIVWLGPAQDGSYVGTMAFQLANMKMKLEDGEYAVLLKLKGPGIERNYSEDAPFLVYGASRSAATK